MKFFSHLESISMMKLWRWTCKNSTLLLRQHPYLVSLYVLTWQKTRFCIVCVSEPTELPV